MISSKEFYDKLAHMKRISTSHKYQVYNDLYHKSIILTNIPQTGAIYQMDFSENISEIHKYEPQSSHFNKAQYLLHCTVKDNNNEEQ